MKKIIVLSSLIGNILEWYDFTLYGFFAVVLGHMFFPVHDQTLSLLSAFGVFAVGFLTRPIGAFIFSHVGDKHGRKRVFSVSLVLMGFSSLLIGLLPTYAQAGILAPVLLILLRMIQGISCGGEFIGSILFLGEHASPVKTNFYSSLSWIGSLTGTLCGSAMATVLTSILTQSSLENWGWRIPFLLGGACGIFGSYFRRINNEPLIFEKKKIQAQLACYPIREAFSNHGKLLVSLLTAVIGLAVFSYMLIIYMPTYLSKTVHIPMNVALLINTLSIMGLIILIPFFARLGDKMGWKKILLPASIAVIIFSLPAYWLISQGTLCFIFMGQLMLLLLASAVMGTIPGMLVKSTPTYIRFTACSIPYNMVLALLGGTTPLVATYLIHKTGYILSPAFYLMLCFTVSLVGILAIKQAK